MVFVTVHFSAAFNLNPAGRWRTLLYKLLLYTVFASSSNLFDSDFLGHFESASFTTSSNWEVLDDYFFFLACFAFTTGDTPPPWRHHQRAATAMHQPSPFHIFKWLLTLFMKGMKNKVCIEKERSIIYLACHKSALFATNPPTHISFLCICRFRLPPLFPLSSTGGPSLGGGRLLFGGV